MNKKYEFTGETIEYEGRTLHRIRALKRFGNWSDTWADEEGYYNEIFPGDLGGWIESEINLSQEDGAWVDDNAKVMDYAKVYEDGYVRDNAIVMNNAEVFGNAEVCDNAVIMDKAEICGCAIVDEDTIVDGAEEVYYGLHS